MLKTVPKEIFKAYDIRGIVGKTLTAEVVEAIGHALGSEAAAREQRTIAIGRDGRLSGPELIAALARGIRKSGIDVIDVGCVATPMVYFAAYHLQTNCAVMLTGSGEAIQKLRSRIEQGDLAHGSGSYTQQDIGADYIARIVSDVRLARPMKITVDCGNGVAGAYVANLYRQLGCEVEEMYCEVDGHFPNHHPDPSDPHNLEDLIAALRGNDSELGLAFDGDGDRLGVVTQDGRIIYPDRQLMLFAWIRDHGGKPTLWKTGHSLVKAKMRETGALLAGEMSGHMFFKERWYGFDDGLYSGARLLEILSKVANPSATLNALPDAFCTPELHIRTAEGENHALLAQLQQTAKFADAPMFTDAREIITLDGLRVEYADGFGLARPSNTTPVIVLRFEADSEAALQRIQDDFRKMFRQAAPHLQLPF
ncbi:MAG: phosphomannomutase/phosphoglucomutase [Nitrosomonadales bacterium]|nr:phosphomannomutase/phosphoglucomutase [Nitrosomonadales bacterium]